MRPSLAWSVALTACYGAIGCSEESGSAAVTGGTGASIGGAGTGGAASSSSRGAGGQGASGGGSMSCDGTPVDAPPEEWIWVPVPGSECGNGSEAGFGINRTAKSKRLLLFLKGGGACFSADDCQAANLDGYGQQDLMGDVSTNLFSRTSDTNPFKDDSFVFVPYCTGDFHAGSRVADYGIHHMGYQNVALYLERIVPTFCKPERVVLLGTSAGGFGVSFTYDLVHRAFGDVPVHMVDDSGPFMRPAYMGAMQAIAFPNWGADANVPPGCPECATAWHELYPFASTAWPTDRMSLVSSRHDPSIGSRFGIDPATEFPPAIDDLADQVIVPLPNMRVFYIEQQGHVWTAAADIDQLVVDGTSLQAFLVQQITGDPAWANVRP